MCPDNGLDRENCGLGLEILVVSILIMVLRRVEKDRNELN